MQITTKDAVMTSASIAGRASKFQNPDRLNRNRFSSDNRKRLSSAGMRTFLAIADRWNLNDMQRLSVLGDPTRSDFQTWVKIARTHGELMLDVGILMRISAVLRIYEALGVLYGDMHECDKWLRTSHKATVFGGRSALDFITSGTWDGLMNVLNFLEAARNGYYMNPVSAVDKNVKPCRDDDLHLREETD
jgi:hypothetical protein